MTRSQVEKIVREMLDEQYGGGLESNDETDRSATRAGQPAPDDVDTTEDRDEPEAGAVPSSVTDTLEALYASLSAEQAEALAALFTAMGDAREGNDDTPSESDGDDGSDGDDVTPALRRRHLARG